MYLKTKFCDHDGDDHAHDNGDDHENVRSNPSCANENDDQVEIFLDDCFKMEFFQCFTEFMASNENKDCSRSCYCRSSNCIIKRLSN